MDSHCRIALGGDDVAFYLALWSRRLGREQGTNENDGRDLLEQT